MTCWGTQSVNAILDGCPSIAPYVCNITPIYLTLSKHCVLEITAPLMEHALLIHQLLQLAIALMDGLELIAPQVSQSVSQYLVVSNLTSISLDTHVETVPTASGGLSLGGIAGITIGIVIVICVAAGILINLQKKNLTVSSGYSIQIQEE